MTCDNINSASPNILLINRVYDETQKLDTSNFWQDVCSEGEFYYLIARGVCGGQTRSGQTNTLIS